MQSSFVPERLHIPNKSNGQSHDVSPPESIRRPDGNHNISRRSSPDVSPITETSSPIVERPPIGAKHTSGIPVLRKTQMFGSAGNMWSNWRAKGSEPKPSNGSLSPPAGTRWDDYSGERTTSEKGKPGQVTPGLVPFDPNSTPSPIVQSQAFGNTTTISGGHEPVRRKRVPSRDIDLSLATREEWKGASGRHKIIRPLMDKPLPPGKSAIYPTGSRRLSESPDEMVRTRDAISPTSGLALSVISDESPTRERPAQPSIVVNDNDSKESPGSTRVESPLSVVTQINHRVEPSRSSSLSPEDMRSPLARHPSTEGLKMIPQPPTPEATPNSSREGQNADDSGNNNFQTSFEDLNLQAQPKSRFSATTYATTAYDSPPATPETYYESPTPTPPSSILNRKRPVPVAGIPNKRKPTPSEAESARDRRHSKVLPKSPPEMEAQDRVASLQATLDNLRRRRINIQAVMHELTNVVQPSSITYDMAARKEVKRTVEGLNEDLSEVMKEEHETGLKLHRAWKRQDKSSAYEPTTLWVRRVTT
ncbi:MAG: hypothetical protein Q9220_000162 [cf. Caloplaca sp. 1 TL-2023]